MKKWTVDGSAEDWRKRQRGDRGAVRRRRMKFWQLAGGFVFLGAIIGALHVVFTSSSEGTKATVFLLIVIACEAEAIRERLKSVLPTELEKDDRYEEWWEKLPTDQKAWYQQHTEEWAEAERDVRRTGQPYSRG